jgi:hypothetical protein
LTKEARANAVQKLSSIKLFYPLFIDGFSDFSLGKVPEIIWEVSEGEGVQISLGGIGKFSEGV